jgi:hypothetical protein
LVANTFGDGGPDLGFELFVRVPARSVRNSVIYANSELLRVQAGEHPDLEENPHYIAPAAAGEAMKENANRAGSMVDRNSRCWS